MAYAGGLPFVWVDKNFSEKVTAWARDRGPMPLLVPATRPLAGDERRRIERSWQVSGGKPNSRRRRDARRTRAAFPPARRR